MEGSKENIKELCSSFNQSFPPNESFNKDDLGNYHYGSAVYSMGLSIDKALVGAGAFGIWNGSKKDYANIFSLFDEFTDSFMIIQGFYRYRTKK